MTRHMASAILLTMTLTELRYIVAVACTGRKRGPTAGGDRSPAQAVGDGHARKNEDSQP
jgi:hypothetical protein